MSDKIIFAKCDLCNNKALLTICVDCCKMVCPECITASDICKMCEDMQVNLERTQILEEDLVLLQSIELNKD